MVSTVTFTSLKVGLSHVSLSPKSRTWMPLRTSEQQRRKAGMYGRTHLFTQQNRASFHYMPALIKRNHNIRRNIQLLSHDGKMCLDLLWVMCRSPFRLRILASAHKTPRFTVCPETGPAPLQTEQKLMRVKIITTVHRTLPFQESPKNLFAIVFRATEPRLISIQAENFGWCSWPPLPSRSISMSNQRQWNL